MSNSHIERVRHFCLALPETTEKLSHGEPTFFVSKKVFVMFANNHHNDGHIAIWIPTPPGIQAMLIEGSPDKFFKPPYVGVRGWIGIELGRVDDEELAFHIRTAWRLIAPPRIHTLPSGSDGASRPRAAKPMTSVQQVPNRAPSGGEQKRTKSGPSKLTRSAQRPKRSNARPSNSRGNNSSRKPAPRHGKKKH